MTKDMSDWYADWSTDDAVSAVYWWADEARARSPGEERTPPTSNPMLAEDISSFVGEHGRGIRK